MLFFQILEILDRVESFQMKSPLMRFLTGVELLLGHAQEWESCAHSGVSIAIYLTEITDLVISWRKLELQCWKNLLEITLQRLVYIKLFTISRFYIFKRYFFCFSAVKPEKLINGGSTYTPL